MNHIKYQHLRSDCQLALEGSNLEKCFELLADNLDDRVAIYKDYLQLRAQFSDAIRHWSIGQLSSEEYFRARSQILGGLLHLINNTLKPADISLLRRIHDRILIVACKNGPTKWENLFNEAFFSYFQIIYYGDTIPDDYRKSDIIVFDDLGCATKNGVFMEQYIREIPAAHILYVGKENPFEDEFPEAFARSANANSKITVYARLQELLIYRKFMFSSDS